MPESVTNKSVPLTNPQRLQFRIRDLLLLVLLIGLALAGAIQQSYLLALLFLAVGFVCATYWWQWSLASSLTLLLIMITLFLLFGPATGPGKGPNHSGYCRNKLRQIALSLQSYHDDYGSFPPAYVADRRGGPLHSWRVLLLPYLEHEDLYRAYRFDEPWDGPNNRQLADKLRRVYSCPADHQGKSSETSYVAVVGPHTAWPGEKAAKLTDLADYAPNVLLVVEMHDSGIHWMEPRDLHVNQMAPTINAARGQGISSAHPEYAHAAFADGSVRKLPASLPAKVLRSWINRDDGTFAEPPGP